MAACRERIKNRLSRDSLAAFDCLQWLRTGERAGQALDCSQSTISRATRKCQDAFGVKLIKQDAEWHVQGDDTLLAAERCVHQLHRWSANRPLRLEAQHWLRDTYADCSLQGWIKGNLNYLEYTRPLQLLRDRVIDAWLCSGPDHPQDDELTSVPLCDMPSWLIARSSHPLFQQAEPPSIEAARRYPVMPLPQGAFPVYQELLDGHGFHSNFSQLRSIADEHGHDHRASEDLALAIASPLTLPLYGNGWEVLPLDLRIRVSDVLVLRREMANHQRAHRLIDSLGQHLRTLTAGQNHVRVLAQAPVV